MAEHKKSELQEFLEKVSAAKNGETISLRVNTPIRNEINGLATISTIIATIGVDELKRIYQDKLKK
jgi:hypothetical protein